MRSAYGIGLLLFVLSTPVHAGFAARDLLLPAAGRITGVGQSEFYTDVWLRNAGDQEAIVTFRFLVSGQANPEPLSVTRSVPSGADLLLTNATESLFGVAGVLGALRVTSDQPVLVTAHVYTTARRERRSRRRRL